MAEWLYEDGIGEARAALVENGQILEARIEWNDLHWTVGTIADARIGEIDRARHQAFVKLPDGSPAILSPLPTTPKSQGSACRVEITRESLSEGTRHKWPKVRLADPDAQPGPAAALRERISARTLLAHGADELEAAGWSELIEEAASGEIAFPGGSLHLSLTPAMSLFDVDGRLPRAELAIAGAAAAARAIRRLGLGGSIGIDLPTLENKAERQAAAAAFDANLPQPFERTAVNGFGFLQIIRRRDRRSLPEMLTSDPTGAALRLLLRRAERCGGSGPIRLLAAPALLARLTAETDWQDQLVRRSGRALLLQPDPEIATWGGHAEAQHS